jgi:nicotinamide-nucleotide amidase
MAHLITSIPGSSSYYMGSSVTYSNESKTQLLNIPAELIEKHGAVSEQVVTAMVESVKKLFQVECAVATTGVAGPSGGTPEKPVGTVWVGVSTPLGTKTYLLKLGDNRLRTIEVAAISGLNFLRKELLKQ